jgi:hypothetical protein
LLHKTSGFRKTNTGIKSGLNNLLFYPRRRFPAITSKFIAKIEKLNPKFKRLSGNQLVKASSSNAKVDCLL